MLNCEGGRLFTCQKISALKSPAAADEEIAPEPDQMFCAADELGINDFLQAHVLPQCLRPREGWKFVWT